MNSHVLRSLVFASLVLSFTLLLVLMPAGVVQAAGNPNPGIVPPHANPHGQSYGDWSIEWWQWLFSIPWPENPGNDYTGDNVDEGQSGPVWFLAPTYFGTQVRTATIPPGKSLFLLVFGFEASTYEGFGETEEELRASAAWFVDQIQNLECIIDNRPVENLAQYRVQSPTTFSFWLPEDNVFNYLGYPGTPSGDYGPAVADGYYLMITPLSRGEHTIHLLGEIPDLGFYQDVTYYLTVAGGPRLLRGPGEAETEVTSWSRVKSLYR